jgi:hypothetical protein
MPHTAATLGPEDGPPLLPRASRVSAVTPDDLPVPALPELPPAITARRRAALAALFGLAAVGESAHAQMGGPGGGGGGGGRGGRGQQQEGARPEKDAKDGHEAAPPRDLVAAFAMRLREGVPELALAPPQQPPYRDFVATLVEVGQHNERRLQRILFRSAANVSAAAPLKSYIAAEVDEGEGRQEALAELKLAYDKLEAQLDERQRGVLVNLFVATRSELQAPRER